MTRESIAFDPIRTDISRRIDDLTRNFRHFTIDEIVCRADALRNLSGTHGLEAVRRLAGGLTDAVSRDGRAAMIPAYLQSLREAAWCDDPLASELLMASVSVRLAH